MAGRILLCMSGNVFPFRIYTDIRILVPMSSLKLSTYTYRMSVPSCPSRCRNRPVRPSVRPSVRPVNFVRPVVVVRPLSVGANQ